MQSNSGKRSNLPQTNSTLGSPLNAVFNSSIKPGCKPTKINLNSTSLRVLSSGCSFSARILLAQIGLACLTSYPACPPFSVCSPQAQESLFLRKSSAALQTQPIAGIASYAKCLNRHKNRKPRLLGETT